MIEANLVLAAHLAVTQRLMLLASSCIYSRDSPQPIREEYLLIVPLEATNEPYAIAKIAGLKLCESYNRHYGLQYVCTLPTNLYGPDGNYDLGSSQVLPALIRKAHDARESGDQEHIVSGSGTPRREFLHVDDLADGCVRSMETDCIDPPINIGAGGAVTIRELAKIVMDVVGFKGEIVFDASKPDGTPRELLDVSRLAELGWKARIMLHDGMRSAYAGAPFHSEPV